jgi:hypothetical protein
VLHTSPHHTSLPMSTHAIINVFLGMVWPSPMVPSVTRHSVRSNLRHSVRSNLRHSVRSNLRHSVRSPRVLVVCPISQPRCHYSKRFIQRRVYVLV